MSALIIPFPAARRTGRIGHVASVLARKNGLAADRYWRQQKLIVRAQMLKAGLDPETIDRELTDFEREVLARVPFSISLPPRGAA
jgi:hypothetical protein